MTCWNLKSLRLFLLNPYWPLCLCLHLANLNPLLGHCQLIKKPHPANLDNGEWMTNFHQSKLTDNHTKLNMVEQLEISQRAREDLRMGKEPESRRWASRDEWMMWLCTWSNLYIRNEVAINGMRWLLVPALPQWLYKYQEQFGSAAEMHQVWDVQITGLCNIWHGRWQQHPSQATNWWWWWQGDKGWWTPKCCNLWLPSKSKYWQSIGKQPQVLLQAMFQSGSGMFQLEGLGLLQL